MQQPTACLTHDEYQTVRETIDVFGLWWEPDEPPSRMSPALMMRGWTIVSRPNLAPLVAVAINRNGRKVLALREDAPLSCQAVAIAHTLAHDILGHPHEVDLILTHGARRLEPNRGVHPAHDAAAKAAAAILLVPDRYAHSGLSPREIASWCGVPTNIVTRRLVGTQVIEDDPPNIVRIDRRRSTRIWSAEDEVVPLRSGGD